MLSTVVLMCQACVCEVNQEESEQNEVDGMKKGADTTSKVMQAKGEVGDL